MLQKAPRDEDKLRELLKLKEKENEQAIHIEDTRRLVTEIEMLEVVLYLVSRRRILANFLLAHQKAT